MDLITRTPGLVHIAEQIFSNLDRRNLLQCQKVNEYWASILRNPWFWYKRMSQSTTLSQEHQKEWMKFCEKLSKLNLTNDMTPGLNFIYEHLEDSVTLNRAYWSALFTLHSEASVESVKIMASLFENPNAPDEFGKTPIYMAAEMGHINIVKILAPLTDNPNAPDKNGHTPIHEAAIFGHTEIVKFLAPLTDNPNAPDEDGKTPIYSAARYGHSEIVKILAPLTDNPNAPNRYGFTPINGAVDNGHTEIVKILAPLIDNPNAPNRYGYTPIYFAARNGHIEIVKILAPLTDNPNFPDKHGRTPSEVATNVEIKDLILEYSSEKCSVGRFTKDVSKKLA